MPKYKDEVTKNDRGEIVKLSIEGSGNKTKDGGLEIKVRIKGKSASLEKYADSLRVVYTENIDVSKVYSDKEFEKILAAELSGDVEYDEIPTVRIKATVEKNKDE